MSEAKILFVARSTTAHSVAGGMENSWEQVARALHLAGYRLSLLTTDGYDHEQLPTYFENTWAVAGRRPGRYSLAWWSITGRRKAPWLDWKPDLVFSVSTAASSLLTIPNRPFPIVAQSHGTAISELKSSRTSLSLTEAIKMPLNISRLPREIIAYRSFDVSIAIGHSVSDQLKQSPYRVPESRVKLIENGIDLSRYSYSEHDRHTIRGAQNIPLASHVSLYIGRLHHQKGVDILLQSFAELPNRNSYLVIVGDGPEKSRLTMTATDLGIEDRLRFVGRIAPSEVPYYLSAADTFVFATRRNEGLPLNILEALASGLEVVTVPSANLPSPLASQVRMTQADKNAFSKVWSATPVPRSRRSKLPDRFTARMADGKYVQMVAEILAERSEA